MATTKGGDPRMVDRRATTGRADGAGIGSREPGKHRQPDGHVDEERPAPVHPVDDDPAHQRSRDGRQTEHGTRDAMIPAAILGRSQVPGRGDGVDQYHTTPQTLQGTEGDELVHRLAQPDKDRGEGKGHDADQKQDPATVEVGEPARNRHDRRRGHHVGRGRPGVPVESPQVGDGGRQHGAHDRVAHGSQKERRHRALERAPVLVGTHHRWGLRVDGMTGTGQRIVLCASSVGCSLHSGRDRPPLTAMPHLAGWSKGKGVGHGEATPA